MSINPPPKPGKRRRKIRWTATILAIFVIGAIAVILMVNRSKQTKQHTPGEKIAGITSKLSLNIPKEAPQPSFQDVTKAAGLNFKHFNGPRSSQLPEDMGSGAAWGDYNNDGYEDLFIVSSGGALTQPKDQWAACSLYRNNGDGTFQQDMGFPETKIIGMAASWGDYDGDGWIDLIVTGYNSLTLFRNQNGRFTFDRNFKSLPGFWAGASWADYDNDGDLDLYICGYVKYKEPQGKRSQATRQYGREVPYTLNPSSYEPERNLFFRNNGNDSFTEIAEQLGISNPKGRSLNALWNDFNDDGWLDLYISNDISDNVLYLNSKGTFKDISHAAWVADYRGAMGLASGDWNGDGDTDLFVTHWIAQENALYDSLFTDKRGTTKDTTASLRFMDVADMAGLGQAALHYIGWGAEFADLDADGWLDLLIANGSTFETTDQQPRLRPQKPFLFWNHKGKSFHNLVPLNPALNKEHVGRGLAVADYNNDGILDYVIVNHDEGVQLFRGSPQMTGKNNWIMVTLKSKSGHVEGAQLFATVNGRRLRRSIGGPSYLSQSSRTVHFGLGLAQGASTLEVCWPGGNRDMYTSITANSYWIVSEGNPVPVKKAYGGKQKGDGSAKKVEEKQEIDIGSLSERERLTLFWQTQRAAVHALKVEKDIDKAIGLLKKALDLDPKHEDSLNYFGQGLNVQGKPDEAIEVFERLTRINPVSHRGFRQLGFLRARAAKTQSDLSLAQTALERAYAINSEETGVPLLLGELHLMQGDFKKASQRFAAVCRSNPRSVEGFFLQAYISWKSSNHVHSRVFLDKAWKARKREKAPSGSTAEGDVKTQMHIDHTLLSFYYKDWQGNSSKLNLVFQKLDNYLKALNFKKR
jgi:enediyne biosynthesis protein E4